MTTFQLYPHSVADGATNMATDEVMLETAIAGNPTLRFYEWSEPTVSLGYFQSAKLPASDPLLKGLPVVRRPSGGALLVHHFELTYCLTIPAGIRTHSALSLVAMMHASMASALVRLTDGPVSCTPEEKQLPGFLCFHHAVPGDVIIGDSKVVGSAQRKHKHALLQHGAILLARSPFTPLLPGVLELTGHRLSPERVATAVIEELRQSLHWELTPTAWSSFQQARIHSHVISKYGSDSWNRKR